MKPTTEQLKLSLNSHHRNPLRDILRQMSNEQLLAERAKASKAFNAKDTRANFNYFYFIANLCEVRGLVAKTPSIGIL